MLDGNSAEGGLKHSTMARAIDELSSFSRLTADEVMRVHAGGRNKEVYNPGAQLRPSSAAGPRAGVIVSGWACEQRILLDGRRQVFAFFIPGDTVVIQGDAATSPRTIVALTRLEFANLTPIVRYGTDPVVDGAPKAFATAMSHHHNRLFDHIVRIGRQTASERVVHLLLELRDRLEMRGLVKAQSFRIPITQEVLGDALGLSIVHINRTVRQLRRDGLIELKCGGVTLLKPSRLFSIANAGYSAAPKSDRSQLWPDMPNAALSR